MANKHRSSPAPQFFSPFIIRVILFVVLFLLLSGLTGSWLISTNKLLFPFYFSIYGSAGKILLFSVLTFLILSRQNILKSIPSPWTSNNSLTLIGSALSAIAFFLLATELTTYQRFSQVPLLAVATHVALLASSLGLIVGVFGYITLQKLLTTYTKPVIVSLILASLLYLVFGYVYTLWPYLSGMVLWAVSRALSLTIPNVTIRPPLTIELPQFSVTIGEYCSGIESLFLLTALYILIGCLEWIRLRRIRFISLYFPLIIGMFLLNIVRVYGIIQAGIWLGPEIAAKLFHTYLGIIIFMLYFFLVWKVLSPVLLISTPQKGAKHL